MAYIGEVAKQFGLPVSTLRYYDSRGLFPHMERHSNRRIFGPEEIEALTVIECLKKSGLSIDEISQFMAWSKEDTASLERRRDLFHKRRQILDKQLQELEKVHAVLTYKCWYYDQAVDKGSESWIDNLPDADIPAHIRTARDKGFAKTSTT